MPIRISLAALALIGGLVSAAFAQTNAPPGVEAQMIVTSADHMNHQPPVLKPGDVTIMDATILDLVPFQAGRDLELFVLIDDAANYDFGSKLAELRRFVTAQPASVPIGVAYIRDGVLKIAENPTTDHQRAARALGAPSGSRAGNPYCALSELIGGWERKSARREIVLVSTGIDDSASGPVCVNAETAISDAERAAVVIYALYNPLGDYVTEKWSKVDSGIVDLAHVAFETGGEAYFTGHTPTATFEPFLTDITEHLAHQYLAKFLVNAAADSGFRTIEVNSPTSELELMKPEKIWVPAPAE